MDRDVTMRTLKLTMVMGAILFGVAAHAEKQLVTLVNAIELSPSNMIIPQSTNGLVTYQPCAEQCDAEHERARLTAETSYKINGRAVKFEDFRKEFPIFKADDSAYALLSVETKSRTITSVELQR